MKVLLFLIYGDQNVYHLELTYSVLSAAQFLKEHVSGVRLVLAADTPNLRPDLPVEHLPISTETLREWQMNSTYNHAAKIHTLHHALCRFDAPTILIDSDTVIRGHPELMFDRIAPGKGLMHACEGRLCDSAEWQEWEGLIERSGRQVAGWPITRDSVMYNTGVFGLHPRDAHLLDEVKAALAGIREHSTMFTAEQLAASLVLGEKLQLSVCEDLVDHYWYGPRTYYHYQMKHMFPGVMNGDGITDAGTPLAPLQKSLPRGRLLHRVAARLKRLRRGAVPEYGFAYMAYLSALSLRDKDPDLANVWAATALNTLIWGMPGQQPRIWADFALFLPGRLDTQNWMQPALRKRWQGYWATQNVPSNVMPS